MTWVPFIHFVTWTILASHEWKSLFVRLAVHKVRYIFIQLFYHIPEDRYIFIIEKMGHYSVFIMQYPLQKKIYGVKKFHSLRSEFHSILTPVEWKFTIQRVESRPVHSIFTPKVVITDVTTQGVTSVRNRVNIHSIFFSFREYEPLWITILIDSKQAPDRYKLVSKHILLKSSHCVKYFDFNYLSRYIMCWMCPVKIDFMSIDVKHDGLRSVYCVIYDIPDNGNYLT